jgi:hypothetical protein
MGGLRGDDRDRLDGRGAGADDAHALPGEVHALVRPVPRVIPRALEALEALAGFWAVERQPVAMMQNRADTSSPRSVLTVQRPAASSKWAAVTRVSSWISRRRSKRSATWLM